MADVALAQRAENRVANGVDQHVRVRVSVQALGMVNIHSAQDEFAPSDQAVHVVADAHVNHGPQMYRDAEPSKWFSLPQSGIIEDLVEASPFDRLARPC